jgi:hypothetical protein
MGLELKFNKITALMYYSSVTIVWLLFAVLTPEEFLPCSPGNHAGSGQLARTSSLFGK